MEFIVRNIGWLLILPFLALIAWGILSGEFNRADQRYKEYIRTQHEMGKTADQYRY